MTTKPSKTGHRGGEWSDFFSFLWMWAAFASGALILSWFVSVVNDVTQRGEQRKLQQRPDRTLVLADHAQQPVVRDVALTAAGGAGAVQTPR